MEEKSEKRRKFRLSWFWVIYLTTLFMAFLLLAAGLGVVSSRLAEYEAAQPKYVAETVFAQYFDPVDYERLIEDARYEADGADADEILDYLKEEVGGEKLTYAVGSSNNPDEIRYLVKAGSKQMASINLKVSPEKTEHGYKNYDFSYIELYLNTQRPKELISVSVDVPSGCSVTVDGESLDREKITDVHLRTDILECMPPDVEGIEYEKYTLDNLDKIPEEVSVTDPSGREAEVSFDEKTGTYTAGVTYSDELAEEYTEFVTKAMEGYAAYVQASKEVGLGTIKAYFDTDSELYADVVAAGSSRWMVRDWDSADYEDVYVGEFYSYTPEIFSCHISFRQVLHRPGKEDYTDYIDMYLYLHDTGGGFKIYGWHNI